MPSIIITLIKINLSIPFKIVFLLISQLLLLYSHSTEGNLHLRAWHELDSIDSISCDYNHWSKFTKPYQDKVIKAIRTKKYTNQIKLDELFTKIQAEYKENLKKYHQEINPETYNCVLHYGSNIELLQFLTCNKNTGKCDCIGDINNNEPPMNFKRNLDKMADKSKTCIGLPGAMCFKHLVHCSDGNNCKEGTYNIDWP